MNVVVDGEVFQWGGNGGIARIFAQVLPRMCALDPSLAVMLFTVGPLSQTPPSGSGIIWRRLPNVKRILRPGRFFNGRVSPVLQNVINGMLVGRDDETIWHPSYYAFPTRGTSRSPYVLSVYDMIHERFPELYTRDVDRVFVNKKRQCIEQADALLCISETTADDLHEMMGVHRSRIRVVPLGFNEIFRRAPAAGADPARKPFLLYVGNRGRYKNFDRTLRAYAAWSERQEVSLSVVGPDWEPAEEALLDTLQVRDRVTLLTRVSDGTLRGLYQESLALIYPSLYEGFGLPLLEAIACGCPIVASRIPSTVEITGDYPVYFEPESIEDLQCALSKTLTNGRGRDKEKAGAEILKRYSLDQTARLTLEAYNAVARRPQ